MTTAYVTDNRVNAHTLNGHMESADRLEAVHRALDEAGVTERLCALAPEPIRDELILTVHTPEYLDLLKWTETQEGIQFGPDTYVLPESFPAARLSAGGVIRAVEAVLAREADNGLVVMRPPGHHAVPSMGMGFCLLANVALGARYALSHHRVKRVLVVDYDVHHGNGTQDVFYADPSVLFISTHQYPWYPGTGALSDTGEGLGEGYTLNIPFPARVGDQSYSRAFESVVWPAAERYAPDLMLVSAGFDAHWADPLGEIQLSLMGYAHLTRELIRMARRLCDGKIVFVMEGGYHREALANGILNVAYELLGDQRTSDPLGPGREREPDVADLLTRVRKTHRLI
ncbi:MAG: histone deacetylase [Anaerolineae bacterium]|nr:histone deacetylase [Anaerolineae bacterium]